MPTTFGEGFSLAFRPPGPAQLEVVGSDFVSPALETGFTDLPALGKLLLIQVTDFHGDSLMLNDHH